MSGFSLVADLFSTIDGVLNTMVTSNVSTFIELASPVVAIMLSVKFVVQGLMMMLSPGSGEPLSEIVRDFIKVVMILSFATAGGLYQTDLISMAQNIPDTVATQLQSLNHTSYTGIAGIIDGGITNCIDAIKTEFQASGISSDGLMSLVIGCILIIPTVVLGGLGAGFIIMAKVLLSLALCLGPIAIFCLCWKPTKQIFSKWVGNVINYSLVVILVALVFSLLMTLFANMITGFINGNGVFDALSTVIGLCVLTVVSVLVLFQVPKLASSFGSGIQADIAKAAQDMAKAGSTLKSGAGLGGSGGSGSSGSGSGNAGSGASESAYNELGSGSGGNDSELSGYARGSRGKAA